MYISIFSDEFFQDVYSVLPVIKEWGMTHVDFRGMINGKPIENQTDEELYALKAALDKCGLKAGVIQSSLCKVHLPDAARQAKALRQSATDGSPHDSGVSLKAHQQYKAKSSAKHDGIMKSALQG